MARRKKFAKLVISSCMVLLMVSIILITRKQTLIATKLTTPREPLHSSINSGIVVGEYGAVVSSAKDPVTRAIVEQVILNVPKTEFSEKKILRYGRLVRYPTAQATILICHGFMTDKYDVGFLRHMFPQGKYNFMTFDFRAHGENSHGQCCTLGRDEALDVITAAQFIKNHPELQEKPLIVYAFSMGAVASIEAQARDNSCFDAMILDCPFDSSEKMIKRCLENIQFTFLGYDFSIPACTFLQKYAFHPYVQTLIKGILKTISHFDTKNIEVRVYPICPADSIQKIRVPCFFIHCKNDEKISIEAVKNIYQSAAGPYKKLWLTNGRRHFDSYFYNPEKYIKEVRSFIEIVVTNSYHNSTPEQIIEDSDEVFAQI